MNVPLSQLRDMVKDGAKVRPNGAPPAKAEPKAEPEMERLMKELIKTQQLLAEALANNQKPAPDINVQAPRVTVAAPNVSVNTPAAPKRWRHKFIYDKHGDIEETISTAE